MELSNGAVKFIEEHIDDIEDNNFDLLYREWEDDRAFYDDISALSSFLLNDCDINVVPKLRVIPSKAFEGVNLPSKIEILDANVEPNAFNGAYGCDTLVIKGDTTLNKRAFYGFTGLKHVVMEDIAVIPSGAFLKCTDLEDILLPVSLEQIDMVAFDKDTNCKFKLPIALLEKGFNAKSDFKQLISKKGRGLGEKV